LIEIIAVIILCRNNARNAKELSKSGGAAIAYTIAFWLGFEILGSIIAILLGFNIPAVYIIALVFAVVGAIIANIISRTGKPIKAEADIIKQSDIHQQP
jgi:hypothetical protein